MASRARASVLVLFLLATGVLLAAASSREEEEQRSLEQCQRRCQEGQATRHQQAQCLQQCKDKQQQEQEGRGRRGEGSSSGREGREDEKQQQQESRRPYVFGPRSFQPIVQNEQGFIKALPPFSEASRLLRGIKNYRVAVMEANPRSFVVPGFADADGIGYVAQGEGVLTLIQNGERQSYTVREGDVIVAPAGTLMYLANTDGRRKLVVVKILHTISVPGEFQYFRADSLVSSLSKRIQRAAFKASDEQLQKVFGRQRQQQQGDKKGFIIRASEEQLRELQRQASSGSSHGSHWPLPPFGGESSAATFNLLEQRPKISNEHGRLYEADARSFRALAEHDVRVALANITAGSMTAPFYNSRSVKIAVVVQGSGEVEIVCPHQSSSSSSSEEDPERRRGQSEQGRESRRGQSEQGQGSESRRGQSEQGQGRQEQEEQSSEEGRQQGREQQQQQQQQQGRYERIRARVSVGSAFVVPPGHPVVEIASSSSSDNSNNNNLQIACFEIRAEKNDRVYLAGANNVFGQLDRIAKDLAFGDARALDEVVKRNQKQGFLPGPEQQQQQQQGQGQEEESRRGGRGDMETFLRMATGVL